MYLWGLVDSCLFVPDSVLLFFLVFCFCEEPKSKIQAEMAYVDDIFQWRLLWQWKVWKNLIYMKVRVVVFASASNSSVYIDTTTDKEIHIAK